jgi:hypothetical protein
VDLTLLENDDPRIAPVTAQNCYNSSDIGFQMVFTTTALTNAASSVISSPSMLPVFVTALVAIAMTLL